MEDDDLAHQMSQLIEALDVFLKDKKLMGALAPIDVLALTVWRRHSAMLLAGYRLFNGVMTKRSGSRTIVPSGPRQGMAVPLAISATIAAAPVSVGAGTAGAVSGWQVGIVAGEVLLPIAAAFVVSAILDRFTGGSLQDAYRRKMVEAVGQFIRVLVQLGEISSALAVAITAEAAQKLSKADLWKKFQEALQQGAAGALAILLAEMLRRFPGCELRLNAYAAAHSNLKKVRESAKSPMWLAPNGRPNKAILKAYADAQEALRDAAQAAAECLNAQPSKR